MSSRAFPWVKLGATFLGAYLMGVGLMKAVVPSPEESYNSMAPDLQRKVDEARRYRLEKEAKLRGQAEAQANGADMDKPIWANSGSK